MSDSVTVPGPHGSPAVDQTFSNFSNFSIANQIATAIAAASTLGALNITVPGPGQTVPAPPPNPVAGGVNELVVTAGGSYHIPAGSPGAPDYVVVLNNTAPVTIFGSPNTSVWGGGSQVTIVDAALTTLSEGAGNAVATLTGAGDVLAGNDQKDTLTAAGNAESIAGGAGANLLIDSGTNDTISAAGVATFQLAALATNDVALGGPGASTVTDAGAGDTIFGGQGKTNVTTSGSNASVVGGSAELDVTDKGSGDKIAAGTAAAFVTLAGSGALVSGGVGTAGASLSVIDHGTSDTIVAGSAFTAVTTSSGSFVQGGTGPLNFVGGTGPSTIIGGSGDSSIFGGAGLTSLLGGNGGAVTYVNTTGGGLFYAGRLGNETIDASLSKGTNTIYGSNDPSGHNLLVGGVGADYINAGAGSDTMVGNGGANAFYFFKTVVGPNANDFISDFSSLDNVLLVGYGPGFTTSTTAGSTTITLSDHTKITFSGVTDPGALNGRIGQV
jgi:Ca2+-binding RTX toxin-like protein